MYVSSNNPKIQPYWQQYYIYKHIILNNCYLETWLDQQFANWSFHGSNGTDRNVWSWYIMTFDLISAYRKQT